MRGISCYSRPEVLLIIAGLLLSHLVSDGSATQLFVSPLGHDVNGDGTVGNPYRSVQAAIDNAFDYDVIVLVNGEHVSDKDIVFARKKLTVRGETGPITRDGGCWPVHTGDLTSPTLTRCNITSWPQTWSVPPTSDMVALDTLATSVQEWPESFRDDGRGATTLHGATTRPIPTSVNGDFSDPGDQPRGNPDDWTCDKLGCLPGFHGAGNLQSDSHVNTTIVGARFVFLDGDEVIIRDLHVRGAYDWMEVAADAQEGGCLSMSGDAAVTVSDSVFSFCRSSLGGGAVALGYASHGWFNGVRFLNNTSTRGGAVLTLMPGDFRFVNCEFSGNIADEGGAVFTTDVSNPVFISSDFYSQLSVRGGVVSADGQSTPSFHDCAFVHNHADDGGVSLSSEQARPTFTVCTFQNNTATGKGGVLYSEGSSMPSVENSSIWFNQAGVAAAFYSASFESILATNNEFRYNRAVQGPRDIVPADLDQEIFDPANNNTVCRNRGVRGSDQAWKCVCMEPYRGEECEITCPGFNSTDDSVCSGHGVCNHMGSDQDQECVWSGGRRWMCHPVARASCTCAFGYSGRECESQCPGMYRMDKDDVVTHQVCTGHGSCILNNGSLGCACDFGWGGDDCSELRLYVASSGGIDSGRRIVRLGDKILVNSAEPGLHLLAINRTNHAVVWDRNYDVASVSTRPSIFADGLDRDGTVNVRQGLSEDGKDGNLDEVQQGPILRNDQQDEGQRFDGEEAANELARDLSLFDSRHLIIVTSSKAWEQGSNLALAQALERCGSPPLSSYIRGGLGAGRAFALIGTPDMGTENGTYIIGPLAPADFDNRSFAELQMNLRQVREATFVKWCGMRVYNDNGVDISHLNGTTCKEVSQHGEVIDASNSSSNDTAINITACQLEKFRQRVGNPTNAVPQGQLYVNGSLETVYIYNETAFMYMNGSLEAIDLSLVNVSLTNETNFTDCTESLNTSNVSTSESPPASTTLRWQAFGRSGAAQGQAVGLRLEVWDLDADVDATTGMLPETRSQLTMNQECCNRSAHWDHGLCRRGRTLVQDPVVPWKLRCVESGWFADQEGNLFGDATFAAASYGTLRGNTPLADRQAIAHLWGRFTLYNEPEWMRDTPFGEEDISSEKAAASEETSSPYLVSQTNLRSIMLLAGHLSI